MLLFRVNDLDDGTTKLHNGSALRDESFQKRIDSRMNGAETRLRTVTRSELEERIEALGPWFHNMNLAGVWTAPGQGERIQDLTGFTPHVFAQGLVG